MDWPVHRPQVTKCRSADRRRSRSRDSRIWPSLEMDPTFSIARERLGEVYARQGRYQEAIAKLQKARTLFGGGPGEMNARLGYVLAASGERSRAQEELNKITRQVLWSLCRHIRSVDPCWAGRKRTGLQTTLRGCRPSSRSHGALQGRSYV